MASTQPRAMIVEDDATVLRIMCRVLARAAFRLVAVNSPARALRLLGRAHQFDLVVTDMTMPEMDGVELAARFQERRPDLPVLIISGYALDQQGIGLPGAAAFLAKPFTQAALLEAARRAMDSASFPLGADPSPRAARGER